MRLIILGLALIAVGKPLAAGKPIATITYRSWPCGPFHCPDYSVTVSSDGHGVFRGKTGTVVIGERTFEIRLSEFRAYANFLAPYRPVTDINLSGPEHCKEIATDQNTVEIIWSDGRGKTHLEAYFGCDMMKNRTMFDALNKAPSMLPIAGFIR